MLVVTTELWKKGDPSDAQKLSVAHIANDCTGTVTFGNYDCLFYKRGSTYDAWRSSRVVAFPRQAKGEWDLLYLALHNCIAKRNEITTPAIAEHPTVVVLLIRTAKEKSYAISVEGYPTFADRARLTEALEKGWQYEVKTCRELTREDPDPKLCTPETIFVRHSDPKKVAAVVLLSLMNSFSNVSMRLEVQK